MLAALILMFGAIAQQAAGLNVITEATPTSAEPAAAESRPALFRLRRPPIECGAALFNLSPAPSQPPDLRSFLLSAVKTVTNPCDIQPPTTLASDFTSFTSAFRSWLSENADKISECPRIAERASSFTGVCTNNVIASSFAPAPSPAPVISLPPVPPVVSSVVGPEPITINPPVIISSPSPVSSAAPIISFPAPVNSPSPVSLTLAPSTFATIPTSGIAIDPSVVSSSSTPIELSSSSLLSTSSKATQKASTTISSASTTTASRLDSQLVPAAGDNSDARGPARSGGTSAGVVAGAVVASLAAVGMIAGIVLYFLRRSRRRSARQQRRRLSPDLIRGPQSPFDKRMFPYPSQRQYVWEMAQPGMQPGLEPVMELVGSEPMPPAYSGHGFVPVQEKQRISGSR
ncbi:hypothetical protein AAL_05405 [Moelleriella libera RCEF 2490]|uniref:Uncharacterized protein n=1 Tax=Moelleriella libera RCEF 2490 TaxID=1081109 RepID=A0A168AAK1_9HYPO|nr:hypothetical protein AAL_05405 [Moelleriella libera RCEF 2490]